MLRRKLWLATAVVLLLTGLVILARTGNTMWASQRSGYPAMVYLCLLFLLFPLVSLILIRKRR